MNIKPSFKKISFVVACFNSENSLIKVVEELSNNLGKTGLEWEIILVNDGSRDDTLGVIFSLCQKDSRIKGIDLSRNFGQQPAMLAGFKCASGDLIGYCDDDGQASVDDIAKILDKIKEGYDFVWCKFENEKRSLLNTVGILVNEAMLKYLFNKPKDLHFGIPWIAKRFVLDQAIKCENPMPYLGGVYLRITSNMANIISVKRDRLYGKSNYNFIKLISVGLNGFTAFSVTPLRIASFIGLLTSVSGFIYMLCLIYLKLNNPNVPLGYSSIMSTILFTSGLIMAMLGMLGEYIGRIYININKVPQYVIRQKFNLEDIE